MPKPTAGSSTLTKKKTDNLVQSSQTGYLLINQQDEIIYSNQQARHFLGLLADDTLPSKQTFTALVQAAHQCHPAITWHGWQQRPSSNSKTKTRRLVYKSANATQQLQLKVEILEQIIINTLPVWAIALIVENCTD